MTHVVFHTISSNIVEVKHENEIVKNRGNVAVIKGTFEEAMAYFANGNNFSAEVISNGGN